MTSITVCHSAHSMHFLQISQNDVILNKKLGCCRETARRTVLYRKCSSSLKPTGNDHMLRYECMRWLDTVLPINNWYRFPCWIWIDQRSQRQQNWHKHSNRHIDLIITREAIDTEGFTLLAHDNFWEIGLFREINMRWKGDASLQTS